jgi:hypothetical protein
LSWKLSSFCFFELNDFLSNYYLNISGTNYDPVRDIYLNENHITNNDGNQSNPVEEFIESKKDTERLHDFLQPYEGKMVKDTGIRLRGTTSEECKEMSRIFAHVKKDKPNFFTLHELSSPGATRINSDFLNRLDSLKKNYDKGWPSGNR